MNITTQTRERFHTCINCAIEIIELMQTGGKSVELFGLEGRSIEHTEVLDLVKLHYQADLTDEQVFILGKMLAKVITERGMTTCSVWSIAHNLEHIFFDVDQLKT